MGASPAGPPAPTFKLPYGWRADDSCARVHLWPENETALRLGTLGPGLYLAVPVHWQLEIGVGNNSLSTHWRYYGSLPLII